jgi:hypothetical protein
MKVGQQFGDYDKSPPSKPDLWASTSRGYNVDVCARNVVRSTNQVPTMQNIADCSAIAQKTRTQADYVDTVEAARLA